MLLFLGTRLGWLLNGFLRNHGLIFFFETFSHVVKSPIIFIVLPLALTNEWQLRQIDVNNVFLHGELFKEDYMVQPLVLSKRGTNGNVLVCRLHKSLYDLKQAAHAKLETLKNCFLTRMMFSVSQSENCLFLKTTTSVGTILLLVYVDDIVVIKTNGTEVEHVITSINNEFRLKDLCTINYQE